MADNAANANLFTAVADDPILGLTAAELAEKIHARELTSVEVTQAFLDRIAAVDGDIHAFLHIGAEEALAAAKAVDESLDAGEAPASPLAGVPLRITQGWGGTFSHAYPDNRHAVDFAVAVGVPVLAARDGTVMQVESGFSAAAVDRHFGGQANHVRVLHDDGTMALYAHLDANGVFVRPGQRVRRGQRLGLSGNTGFSTGPHLHFVIQANRGMRLESLPFRMFGPGGILRFHDPTP